tara:strand:- start:1709 stop:2641 length:933 start_codon:yes stop_codon:yes gene_type:complete
MYKVNVIDAVPGEVEVLRLMTGYLGDRLFTPRQRASLDITINATRRPIRVPISRDMLLPQKAGFGLGPPTAFEMTVSTAAGIRDAGQVIAHELLHVSQVTNGRLVFNRKTKKIDRQRKKVELARWMGGKPVIIDQLPWHTRPWEIEACHWQVLLVDEFLTLASGSQPFLQLQKPGKQRLALLAASLPAVAVANGHDKGAGEPILVDDVVSSPVNGMSNGDAGNGNAGNGHNNSNGFEIGSYGLNGHNGNGHASPGVAPNGHSPARKAVELIDGVLQITVPGLDTPRALEQGALIAKRQDLQNRGLLRSAV